MIKLVVLESPYAGDVERNLRYGRLCVKDSLMRDESPIASHLLYTQEGVLDDTRPLERRIGIRMGWEWLRVCDYVVAYTDYGITGGIQGGIDLALKLGKQIEFRKITETQNDN
jgi:hypothetical protein